MCRNHAPTQFYPIPEKSCNLKHETWKSILFSEQLTQVFGGASNRSLVFLSTELRLLSVDTAESQAKGLWPSPKAAILEV
jgi:hypothetical protein